MSNNIILAPRWTSTALQLANTAYIDCGTPTVLSNLTSFTLEVWVNPASLSGFQALVGNVDNNIGGQYQLFINNGYVYAYVGIAPYLIQSPQPITANAWHHLAATFDGTSKLLTLYVDGNAVASQTFSGTLPRSGANTLIGAGLQNNLPTWYLQGQIGRVMIWNSVRDAEAILNDSVQVSIYKATETPDLVLYTDFSVMPAVDGSGNDIQLNFKNGAQYLLSVPSVVMGNQNGYVDCGSYEDYSIPGNAPYTLEGWFFPEAAQTGTLVSYGKGSQWEYQVVYENSQLIARRNSDALQIVSSQALPINSYYHFAVTYDGNTKALSLYVNGNLQTVEYFPSPVTAVPGGNVLVGAQYAANGSPSQFFQGAVQNLRIWNVCLEQSEIFQWMFNDIVNDNRLVSNYDFTVNPPVDTTDRAVLQLQNGAVQTLQTLGVPPTEPIAMLGIAQSINAIYLNQNVEQPVPPTPAEDFAFVPQPELFSTAHKEASWNDFVAHMRIAGDEDSKARFRNQFEEAFARARDMMDANPDLKKVFTRIDENGMTRVIYHGVRGDMIAYEGAIGAVSDCTLWWISFIYMITVGFFQALGLLPTTGNIATRIYNLIRNNATAWNALNSLAGRTITASAAISFMGVIYSEGLMWTIIKFVLTSAGWYALFWILRKVIAIVTGLEAAAILAGFIVWASQLTIQSLKYNSSCGSTAPQPAMA